MNHSGVDYNTESPKFFLENVGGLKVNHNDYGGGALG